MKIYVSTQAKEKGYGTKELPFQTITEAAGIAAPGDEVIVSRGVYRESVNPIYGGMSDKNRIIYRSEIERGAIITGAEKAVSWTQYENDVWEFRVNNSIFGEYNPYTELVKGDWYFPISPVHTGKIYFNGKAMYEVPSLDAVLNPVVNKKSWDSDFSLYNWCCMQMENETVIYGNFRGANPNQETVEYNVRRNCFYSDKIGINYITLSGFVIKQAATQWAPPTAYQEGMIGPHWSKGWTKENIGSHTVRSCNIHDCGQAGIVGHLGGIFSVIEDNHIHHINNKQDLFGAEIGGIKMHAAIDVIFRRNHIHHCTRGILLDWQAQGTRVSCNLFHDNVPPQSVPLEYAFEVGEDLFVEVSHGPTLIDNNVFLSPFAARLSTQGIAMVHNLIAGSFTAVGTGTNMDIKPHPTPRYTPYHVPHCTEIAGFMSILHGDARFYNNIFVQQKLRKDLFEFVKKLEDKNGKDFMAAPNLICGTKPYDGYPTYQEYFDSLTPPTGFAFGNLDKYYEHLPVYSGGNLFLNGAEPYDKEENEIIDNSHVISVQVETANGKYYLSTNLYHYLPTYEKPLINTAFLGKAFEPEQAFENVDGFSLYINQDFFGEKRGKNPCVDPFEHISEQANLLTLW